MLLYDVQDIFEKNGFHLDDEDDEHEKFFNDCCKSYYDAVFENKYGDELDKLEETVDKRFNEFAGNYSSDRRVKENAHRMAELNDRIEETRQKIADINARINMINGYMEHERKKEQPFMLTVDNDKPKTKKSKDKEKEKKPEEMTLLEKLNQRSDAGILADKFTNFLSVNSLQK